MVYVPSRKAIKMKPELIVETRKTGLVEIRFLDSTKHLVVNLKFLPVMARLYSLRCALYGSASTALKIFFNRHKRDENNLQNESCLLWKKNKKRK